MAPAYENCDGCRRCLAVQPQNAAHGSGVLGPGQDIPDGVLRHRSGIAVVPRLPGPLSLLGRHANRRVRHLCPRSPWWDSRSACCSSGAGTSAAGQPQTRTQSCHLARELLRRVGRSSSSPIHPYPTLSLVVATIRRGGQPLAPLLHRTEAASEMTRPPAGAERQHTSESHFSMIYGGDHDPSDA